MSKQNSSNQVPEGYWIDADGRLVPEQLVKPIDRKRDEVVSSLVAEAKEAAEALAAFKARTFDQIAAFVELSAKDYRVRVGGDKGNVTLTSYDGRYKIVRQVSETLVFDERLQVAKELIDQCIQRWGDKSTPEMVLLVQDAFQVDKAGKVSTKRVLGLRRHAIDDPKWKQAMKAITDSVRTDSSKSYVRFYERDAKGGYQPISLDVATA